MHDVTLLGRTAARFLGTGGFLIIYSNCNKKYTNSELKNFTEIRPVKVALTYGDGQTDMTKLIGPFLDYVNQANRIERG